MLAHIRQGGGKLARAWAMKEMVREIFAPGLAVEQVSQLLDRLLARLARCRLQPFVRLGRTIRKHRKGILDARRLKLSNARAEALNNKAKLIIRRAYGFHTGRAALALILLACGPSHSHSHAVRRIWRPTGALCGRPAPGPTSHADERRGLRYAGYATLGVILIVALLTVIPGGPLGNPDTGKIIGDSPFMDSIVVITALHPSIGLVGVPFGP